MTDHSVPVKPHLAPGIHRGDTYRCTTRDHDKGRIFTVTGVAAGYVILKCPDDYPAKGDKGFTTAVDLAELGQWERINHARVS